MVNLNRVFLVGNLTKDPELRYTPQGTAVATLRIAVNTPYKDKSGQMQKEVCFINVVTWRQIAEVCNQYLQKGSPVFVEGRLQSRTWQDAEGKNRTVFEVLASRVQFMPRAVKEDSKEIDLGAEPEAVSNNANDNSENQALGEMI